MQIKYNINPLEMVLKRKFPEIPVEIYYSRRRKLVHIALDRPIHDYPKYVDFLKEIEQV